MKKLLTILLVTLLVFSSLPIANAASITPAFVVESINARCGETIEVGIDIQNNPGITALQLKVEYSDSDLELLSIDNAGLFTDSITHGSLEVNPLTISWYASDSKDKSSNGTLAILKFKVRENAQSSDISISFDPDNVFNSSFNNIDFDTVEGSVTVIEKTLTKISVSKLPTKTTYSIGESLDTNGLQLKAEYDDGSNEIVTNGFTTSGFSSQSTGKKTVTVVYQGKSATFDVSVIAPSFEVGNTTGVCGSTVELNIDIENNPGIAALQLNVEYSDTDLELLSIENGEVFDDSITYSPLDVKPVVISWFASNSQNNSSNGTLAKLRFKIRESASSNTVKLSYDPDNVFNISFDNVYFETFDGAVTVKEKSLTKISVSKQPTKTTYFIGQALDTTGLELKAEYDDGSSETITSGFNTSGYSSTTAGYKTVTVSYGGKTTTFKVTVRKKSLTKIYVSKLPLKTEYFVDEALDTTGLELKADYDDGSTETITSGFITSGFNSTTAGTKTVTVAYGSKTASFKVKVSEATSAILGDIDNDDAVTIIDATYIQRKLASIPTPKFNDKVADTDEDGELTIIDATFIQRWLAALPSNDKIGEPIK
ncbi:MAG: bacterial Ig-like domain-containing protein [Ruminococcus sp.]|nr:bacterial Ig-like domain-containing protein [Ruminococcus sp.]